MGVELRLRWSFCLVQTSSSNPFTLGSHPSALIIPVVSFTFLVYSPPIVKRHSRRRMGWSLGWIICRNTGWSTCWVFCWVLGWVSCWVMGRALCLNSRMPCNPLIVSAKPGKYSWSSSSSTPFAPTYNPDLYPSFVI